MVEKTKNKIPYSEKLGYGIGALSYGIPFQIISTFFVFYASAVLGISGTLTGAIMAFSVVWDAFTDPVMGYISDQTSKNVLFGRRLFYVFIGAIGIAVTNYFMWQIDPGLQNTTKVVLLGLLLILFKTFSTMFTTPYMALGAELSEDYNERTTVQSFRTAFYFLGFFAGIIAMALLFGSTPEFENGQMNPEAYGTLGQTVSVIVLVSAALCILLTRGKSMNPKIVKIKRSSFSNMLKETAGALKCDEFRNISLALLFINMAMALVGAVGLHVFTYTFALNNYQIAIVFAVLFSMTFVAQPIWVYIAKRFEKRTALIACIYIDIFVALLFLIFVFASEWVSVNYLTILPLAAVMGLSIGGSIALPYSMIIDTIDKDAYHTGVRKEGVFYGCATFLFKLSQALAIMFVGLLLDVIGFDKNLVQDKSVYFNLGLILPVGFLVCFIIALSFVRKYTLNQKIVAEYQKKIHKQAD